MLYMVSLSPPSSRKGTYSNVSTREFAPLVYATRSSQGSGIENAIFRLKDCHSCFLSRGSKGVGLGLLGCESPFVKGPTQDDTYC